MPRTLVWIPADQLLLQHPALTIAQRADTRVALVWSRRRAARLPYQRKHLVLLLAAMQHYAERLRVDGWDVRFENAPTLNDGLRRIVADFAPDAVLTMAASEYKGRAYQTERLKDVVGAAHIDVLPNTQFLTGHFTPFPNAAPDKNVIFENFYRRMREHFDVLMDAPGEPAGGEWNYDKENRKPLPAKWNAPDAPGFAPSAITRAAMEEVAGYTRAVGTTDDFDYAVTHEDAARALNHFISTRLATFGPYEDAMTERHGTLWHSVLSPYINIGLLTPMQMIEPAVAAYREGRAPLNSVEGFVRQVIGWREYMYWNYWRLMPDLVTMNHWGAARPMPQMFWDGQTDMNCVHHVASRALATGYTHHIERLMIVSNFCTLAGIDPQAVTHWFKSLYIDAYDWVMQTNVVGMGLNADGGIIATKPYIGAANYINNMSDYCKGCRFNPKKRVGEDACPYNALYWNFLMRHEGALRRNPRLGRNVLGLANLDDDERRAVAERARTFLDGLAYYHDEEAEPRPGSDI